MEFAVVVTETDNDALFLAFAAAEPPMFALVGEGC
jgi:hypothetical protein